MRSLSPNCSNSLFKHLNKGIVPEEDVRLNLYSLLIRKEKFLPGSFWHDSLITGPFTNLSKTCSFAHRKREEHSWCILSSWYMRDFSMVESSKYFKVKEGTVPFLMFEKDWKNPNENTHFKFQIVEERFCIVAVDSWFNLLTDIGLFYFPCVCDWPCLAETTFSGHEA